jgi:hypothetical protein
MRKVSTKFHLNIIHELLRICFKVCYVYPKYFVVLLLLALEAAISHHLIVLIYIFIVFS